MVKLLAKIMQQKGWNQYELAQELNLNPATVSRWLKGISNPSQVYLGFLGRSRRLRMLCRELHISYPQTS